MCFKDDFCLNSEILTSLSDLQICRFLTSSLRHTKLLTWTKNSGSNIRLYRWYCISTRHSMHWRMHYSINIKSALSYFVLKLLKHKTCQDFQIHSVYSLMFIFPSMETFGLLLSLDTHKRRRGKRMQPNSSEKNFILTLFTYFSVISNPNWNCKDNTWYAWNRSWVARQNCWAARPLKNPWGEQWTLQTVAVYFGVALNLINMHCT